LKKGFGTLDETLGYKVLDERVMRASAGIMMMLGILASINAFILQRYIVVPWISGFLALNFMVGLFIGSDFSPTILLGKIFVRKQSPLPIGAVQKQFAWSLGLTLSLSIFTLSLFLLNNPAFFEPVCMLCILCIFLLFFETAFGICIGCKLYYIAIDLGFMKKPTVQPNCMGDSCELPQDNS